MLPIFDYTDADLSLDEAEEARLIEIAQGRGPGASHEHESSAKTRLIEAYGPALRAAVGRYSGTVGNGFLASDRATQVRSTEDLQSAAIVGILEAIAEHDPERHPRLAGTLVHHLNRALSEEAMPAFAVPTRTLSRFFGIIRAADGDFRAAEELAPSYAMSRETFRDLLELVSAQSLDAFVDGSGDGRSPADFPAAQPLFSATPIVDVEDRILVDMAFRAMDDEELRVCELYYGFTEYDPVPDAEIAHRIGASRPAVQRKRMKALSKARKALGVELEEH